MYIYESVVDICDDKSGDSEMCEDGTEEGGESEFSEVEGRGEFEHRYDDSGEGGREDSDVAKDI